VLASVALAAATVLGGCTGETPRADEAKPRVAKRPVAESEVPKPVLDSWAKSYPGARATTWFERGGVYFAKGGDATRWLDVKIASDGSLKEVAEELPIEAAPATVKGAFAASPYAKMTFVDAYRRLAPGSKDYPTLFKLVLLDGAKPVIAVYRPDGSFVKQKDMPKEKLEKWRAEHVKPTRT